MSVLKEFQLILVAMAMTELLTERMVRETHNPLVLTLFLTNIQ